MSKKQRNYKIISEETGSVSTDLLLKAKLDADYGIVGRQNKFKRTCTF